MSIYIYNHTYYREIWALGFRVLASPISLPVHRVLSLKEYRI